jgi:NAD(P)-dependent dehydrogenase (short-subunit alcohol dehydrogenase family)
VTVQADVRSQEQLDEAVSRGIAELGQIDILIMFAGHEGGTREDLLSGGRSFHALKGAGMLSPRVLADAALWLVSDGAAAVTGVALPVDAGHMLLAGMNPAPVG